MQRFWILLACFCAVNVGCGSGGQGGGAPGGSSGTGGGSGSSGGSGGLAGNGGSSTSGGQTGSGGKPSHSDFRRTRVERVISGSTNAITSQT